MEKGTVSTDGTTVFYVNGKSVDVKSGSINLSCMETDSGLAYYVSAAFKDANDNSYVINRSIIQFFAYDMYGYLMATENGIDLDYTINLKDTETTAIREVQSKDSKSVSKFLRNGRMLIKNAGKTYNVDGSICK